MNNKNDPNRNNLQGYALTHEQISDVYTAGTSDGIHLLAGGKKVKITEESFESGEK